MIIVKEHKPKYLFVDLENVHNVNVDKIKNDNVKVFMLVGKLQNALPFKLIERTQELGSNLTWVKIASDGRNNLDFHLCYLMGEYNKIVDVDIPFYVLSKDKGFDGVIRFINQNGRKCFRVEKI